MQIKNQSFYQKMICDAHNECQERLFGIRSAEPVTLISKNKVVIISKKNDKTAGESRTSIRGRRLDNTLLEMRREQYDSAMKERLSEITGYDVLSIQSDIQLNNGEKAEVYCLDQDLLTF